MKPETNLLRTRLVEGLLLLGLLVSSTPARAADWYAPAPSDCSGTEPVMAAFVALLPSSIAVHAASTSSAYAEASISLINDFNKYNGEKIVHTFVLTKQKAADYR